MEIKVPLYKKRKKQINLALVKSPAVITENEKAELQNKQLN